MACIESVNELEREYFFARKPLPKIYVDYINYSRDVKGLSLGSIQNRRSFILAFLNEKSNKSTYSALKKLTRKEVQDYTMDVAAKLTRNQKRALVIALRDFFRFLHLFGHTSVDLSESVPTITAYRMQSIPRSMPWNVVETLLNTLERHTFGGIRDYAIILVLARYGVRSCQLIDLRLGDIDWKKKTIFFKEVKGGKAVMAPLYDDVAKAIMDYFKAGRKDASKEYDQVFLKTGQYGSIMEGQVPLGNSTWNIVSRAMKRSGYDSLLKHARGPHAIRHAFASKLLDEDVPLKSISDLLGHRSMTTTFVYTKSSVKHLKKLGLPWPKRSGNEKARR